MSLDQSISSSRGYREQLAGLVRIRQQPVEDILYDAYIKDRAFAPGDPDRGTAARRLAHVAVLALVRSAIVLVLSLAALVPAPVAAEPPLRPPAERSAAFRLPPPDYCEDRHMLAFLVVAEANVQPYEAHLAVAQIIRNEAASNLETICALARFGTFVTPYQFALAHPDSWTAHQYDAVPEWAYDIADEALLYRVPDVLPGIGHFDGSPHGGAEIVIGQIYFRP